MPLVQDYKRMPSAVNSFSEEVLLWQLPLGTGHAGEAAGSEWQRTSVSQVSMFAHKGLTWCSGLAYQVSLFPAQYVQGVGEKDTPAQSSF